MHDLLVIIPVYNEEENIQAVIEELRRDVPYADILAVNDCSRDGSERILRSCGVRWLNTPFNLGYAAVVQTGFKYAVRNDYRYVAQFDGDGQHVAAELDKMYQVIKDSEIDIVLGSRFLEKTDYHHPFLRRLGTSLFRMTIRLICHKRITDPTSGLQVLSQRVYTLYSRMNNYPEYPDANLITEMLLNGYRIEEVAVRMRERLHGVSMHTGLFKSGKYMLKMTYSLMLMVAKYRGRRNKSSREE